MTTAGLSGSKMNLGTVRVFGITTAPTAVVSNGVQSQFTYDNQNKVNS